MPTGYTYIIEEGCTFEEFLFACARNFGALIEMRDAPMDAPIPDTLGDDSYEKKSYEEALDELKQLENMSTEEAENECATQYANNIERIKKAIEKAKHLQKLY